MPLFFRKFIAPWTGERKLTRLVISTPSTKLRVNSGEIFLNPSHSLVIMGFARHFGGAGTTVPHVLQVRSFSSLENFW